MSLSLAKAKSHRSDPVLYRYKETIAIPVDIVVLHKYHQYQLLSQLKLLNKVISIALVHL